MVPFADNVVSKKQIVESQSPSLTPKPTKSLAGFTKRQSRYEVSDSSKE